MLGVEVLDVGCVVVFGVRWLFVDVGGILLWLLCDVGWFVFV